jgi:hypothetical protein
MMHNLAGMKAILVWFGMLAVLAAMPLAAGAQTPANPDPLRPDFSIEVEGTFDAETTAEFMRRVQDYEAMRNRLEVGLPPLVVTTDADEIESFEHTLADRIRHARGKRRGQLFTGPMEGQLKRMLVVRADASTIAALMEDGPGEFDVDVNDTYSKKYALATMPPNLLLVLPDLPKDLEYRFVGRHLILRDARANIIVDEIPYAIRCRDCVAEPEHEGDDDDDRDDARRTPEATGVAPKR